MENTETLKICLHCLMAIESHEGRQRVTKVELDDEDEVTCEWCDEVIEDCYYYEW